MKFVTLNDSANSKFDELKIKSFQEGNHFHRNMKNNKLISKKHEKNKHIKKILMAKMMNEYTTNKKENKFKEYMNNDAVKKLNESSMLKINDDIKEISTIINNTKEEIKNTKK